MTSLPSADQLSLKERITLLSGSDAWRTAPVAGVPKIMLSDGPHGIRAQHEEGDHLGIGAAAQATCFPPAVTLASTWDRDLVEEVGAAVAVEAKVHGVAVVLGPGMNIKRHPLCGRNFEYLSEDPFLSGQMAATLVTGIQAGDVGACIKHFAVNNQEGHRFVVDAVVDERTLREIYLAGFEHVVKHAKPWTVMAAYNSVNGDLCTENKRLLTEILREEWGFDGLVMSDWGATGFRPRTLEAGLDLEMPSSHGISDDLVAQAVADGELSEAAVTDAAQHVMDLVAKAPAPQEISLPTQEHDVLARSVAAAGTVLLRNDGTLPLADDVSIGVIGDFAAHPRFQGAGSSQVTPTQVTTALDAFGEAGVAVRFAKGYDAAADSTADEAADLLSEAVRLAREVDVPIVLAGLPSRYESEGFDRTTMDLPPQHVALVTAVSAANPRTVVVLSNGSPVTMPWRDQPAAIVEAYLGGQATGGALVDVLLGKAEPGGRLAETFPESLDDVAANPYFPGVPRQVEHREGLFVGYRHAVTAKVEPAFPFGFGLSYTQFEWDEPHLDRFSLDADQAVAVTLRVHNTGDRAGSDVVQVYLADQTGVALRPARELAGFAKVWLEPGKTSEVTITIEPRSFAFYDVRQNDWATPTGAFEVQVARSSAEVVFRLPVTMNGTVTEAVEDADTDPVATSDRAFADRLRRPIPTPAPARPFTRDSTLLELSVHPAGKALHAAIRRSMVGQTPEADVAARLMMNAMVDELPLRAAALFSGGKLSWPSVDLIVEVCNNKYLSAGSKALTELWSQLRRL